MKIQKRFRSEKHNVFTEEINKIALSSNDHKRAQSLDSMETYAHKASKDLVCTKEEIKFNNTLKQYKMFNFDYIKKEDIKEHNPSWPEIPDHAYRMLIVGGSGCGKTNALVNLINQILIIFFYMLKIHMKQNINH